MTPDRWKEENEQTSEHNLRSGPWCGGSWRATWCGAVVVVTVNVMLAAEPLTLTCSIDPEFAPLVRLQPVSFAFGSGVQATVAVPLNPPLEVMLSAVEPPPPGLETMMPAPGVTLTGPRTVTGNGSVKVAVE
jgi:hypothetical protein